MNSSISQAGMPVYLDHNATTPVLPEVVDAILPWLKEHFGNPSSSHAYGHLAREAVAIARAQVADLIGCDPSEITFTSGGTEANNLAIHGVVACRPDRMHIVTSVIEHPATEMPCAYLEAQGYAISRVPVDETGMVELDTFKSVLRTDTALVSIMHANSETGTLQPIHDIAVAAHEHGAVVHSDAAQTTGKISYSVDGLGNRHDLLCQPAGPGRFGRLLMAAQCKGVLLLARDPELLRQHLRGLAHVKPADGVGQAFQQGHDRLEIRRSERRQYRHAPTKGPRLHQPNEELRHPLAEQQRDLAHRLGSAGDDEVGLTRLDLEGGRRERLHPRRAVAVDGVGDHVGTQAGLQSDYARHVGGSHRLGHVAEDHLVDLPAVDTAGGEQLTHNDRAEVVGSEVLHRAARLAERRADAVENGDSRSHGDPTRIQNVRRAVIVRPLYVRSYPRIRYNHRPAHHKPSTYYFNRQELKINK